MRLNLIIKVNFIKWCIIIEIYLPKTGEYSFENGIITPETYKAHPLKGLKKREDIEVLPYTKKRLKD